MSMPLQISISGPSYSFSSPSMTPGKHPGFHDILFDWKTELQCRVHAATIMRSTRSTLEDLHAALVILLGVVLVRSASPIMPGYERVPSCSLAWVMDILKSTNRLQLPTHPHRHTYQTLARLRSYLTLIFDEHDHELEEGKSRMTLMRTRSRRQVYDLSSYNKDNDWRPFMPKTGKVDWFYVECIMNVITFNLTDPMWHFPYAKPPCGLEATRAYSAPHATTLAPHDGAGVEGNWSRVVSFMDHRCVASDSRHVS